MPKKNLSGLASLTKERAAWNKVMSSTYGTKLKGMNRYKRTTRRKEQRKASRARKANALRSAVNADTKQALEDRRLELLEANNHNDDLLGLGGDDDDDYDYGR